MAHYTTADPLTAFLYEIMRDHLPIGVLEKIIKQDEASGGFVLSNPHLGAYADELAKRLKRSDPTPP